MTTSTITPGWMASLNGWRFFVPDADRWNAQSQGYVLHYDLLARGLVPRTVVLESVDLVTQPAESVSLVDDSASSPPRGETDSAPSTKRRSRR